MPDIQGSLGQQISEVRLVAGASPLPVNAVPVNGNGTGAASAATATLTAVAGKTTYIQGFVVSGLGATAAAQIAVTVTGLLGGPQTFFFPVPVGAGVAAIPLVVVFPQPLAASAQNTNIVVSAASFGAGNTASGVNAWGYNL